MRRLYLLVGILLFVGGCNELPGPAGPPAEEVTEASIEAGVTVDGNPLDDVVVTVSGTASRQGTTNTSGERHFTDLGAGDYTVCITNPNPDRYRFDEVCESVPVDDPRGIYTVHFAGERIPTSQATIRGTVSADGTALSSVTVALSGTTSRQMQTNASGQYRFDNLGTGTYTVRITNPDTDRYTFPTTQKQVSVEDPQETHVADFAGEGVASASAVIVVTVLLDSDPEDGATVRLSGAKTATGVTSASGKHRFENLGVGSYQVTLENPCPNNCSFEQLQRTVTIDDAAGTVVTTSFSGTRVEDDGGDTNKSNSISGRVFRFGDGDAAYDAGEEVEGAQVCAAGPTTQCVTTAADGTYIINDLEIGSYDVSATKSGFDFRKVTDSASTTYRITFDNLGVHIPGTDFRSTQ